MIIPVIAILIGAALAGCGNFYQSAGRDYAESVRGDAHAQADAVSRNIDAWQDNKITYAQSNYLLNLESRWETGEITQQDYEREEKKLIGK